MSKKTIFEEDGSGISMRERISVYTSKWPIFLLCILLCVAAGIFYVLKTPPKYLAYTSFLIKGTENAETGNGDFIQAALNGKPVINLSNEIMLLSSSALLERTIEKHNYNISYFDKGKFVEKNIYNQSPFVLYPQKIADSSRAYDIYLKKLNVKGGIYSYKQGEIFYEKPFLWDSSFFAYGQVFILSPSNKTKNSNEEYIVRWQPVSQMVAELSENFKAKPYDKETSAIQLEIITGNLEYGKDVLNALYTEFNQSDISDRSKLSENTVNFIDDRLLAISEELKGVEGTQEDYQVNNQLIDIKGQSTQSLANTNDVSKTIKDLAIQQGVATMILDYFTNPVTGHKLVPSSLGLNDGTLASLITQYNELQLKKERETPLVAPNSTVMQDLNIQIANLKSGILESLNNIRLNLKLQQQSFQHQYSTNKNYLSAIPHNERVLQEIKRKQSITEGLYLYLLQKREEAAISSTASNIAHYIQIDRASGYGPIAPNKTNIVIYTLLLGFFLAFGFIYFKNMMNEKINSKEDITNRISVPVVGEIAHVYKNKSLFAVLERGPISEQFRSIRTNLSILLKDKNKKTILITSSTEGEGKTFVSLNYAAVCAFPGKKVALLEFDIRKPGIHYNLNLPNTKGLTDYLSGEVNCLYEIARTVDKIPNLHIYPCGLTLHYPADLLLSEKMQTLFEDLQAQYDYIIIDSPPVRPVTDSFLLAKYSDIVFYVIRNQKTLKKQVDFLSEKIKSKSFTNVAIVLNDIRKVDTYGYDYNYNIKSNGVKSKKIRISSIPTKN